jgi:hypothetical protein
MLDNLPTPLPAIRISIDVSAPLLEALQKLSSAHDTLTREERFEVAAIKFLVARALAVNKRAGTAR